VTGVIRPKTAWTAGLGTSPAFQHHPGTAKVRPNPTLIPAVIPEAWHSIERRLSPFYFAGNRKVAHSVCQ
jgi:hypothetical protein